MFAFGLNVNRKYFNQSLRLLWEELNDAAASQHCAGARNCLHKSPTQPQAPSPVDPMEATGQHCVGAGDYLHKSPPPSPRPPVL